MKKSLFKLSSIYYSTDNKHIIFRDSKLPITSNVENMIKGVFGFGLTKSRILMDNLGLKRSLKFEDLTKYHYSCITNTIRKNFVLTGTNLKALRKRNIQQKYFILNSYQATKYKAGLPVRGQKTRTNAKTTKRLRSKLFSEKKKVSKK